jgi:hypothetical protein
LTQKISATSSSPSGTLPEARLPDSTRSSQDASGIPYFKAACLREIQGVEEEKATIKHAFDPVEHRKSGKVYESGIQKTVKLNLTVFASLQWRWCDLNTRPRAYEALGHKDKTKKKPRANKVNSLILFTLG